MQITIGLRYFALIRDLSGKSEETLSVEAGSTAAEVYLSVANRYALPLALTDIRVAVNDEFTTSSHPLKDRDVLVFIPPVAGG